MAIVEEPLALPSGEPGPVAKPLGVFTRPRETSGLVSWMTTVDHKKIGIMYGAAAMFFLLIGGVAALAIRIQLATPNSTFLSADAYNRIFTMHGTVMVFLVVMPIGAAFANYMMPIQVGARDVAFPRINAFSFWVFFFGGIMLNTSWFLGGGANGGWFNYAPNNGLAYSPSTGIDFWNIGLLIVGFGSLTGAINLITTVINLRAPGMSLDEDAHLRLDDPRHPVPAAVRHPGSDRGPASADVRSHLRCELLQRRARRRSRCCGSTFSGSSVIPRSTS